MIAAVADLHIHSCLSPCGDLEMSPGAIVEEAKRKGLTILALTDHNSARNTPAFEMLCRREGILPVPGLEVTTREEAHTVCLFETADEALSFGTYIESLLPGIPNDPDKMGDQVYVNEDEEILGLVDQYLNAAADLSIDELVEEVHRRGGLVIPAHIDKPVFSLPSQLGFLPDLPYDALESTRIPCPVPGTKQPIITTSDAHYLHDIGKRMTVFILGELSFAEFSRALTAGAGTPEGMGIG